MVEFVIADSKLSCVEEEEVEESKEKECADGESTADKEEAKAEEDGEDAIDGWHRGQIIVLIVLNEVVQKIIAGWNTNCLVELGSSEARIDLPIFQIRSLPVWRRRKWKKLRIRKVGNRPLITKKTKEKRRQRRRSSEVGVASIREKMC